MLRESDSPKNAKVHIVFIDKNHPVNSLDKTITMIKQNVPQECTCHMLYLIPKINNPMPQYPFSFTFFFQVYQRLQKRDEHETLSNEDPLLATQVLFMFMKMYNRESFNQAFLSEYQLDGFLEVPLTIEDVHVDIP